MKHTFKWIAGILGVLVLAVGVAVVLGLQLGERKKMRVVEVALTPVAYATDSASLERLRVLEQENAELRSRVVFATERTRQLLATTDTGR